MLEQNKINNKGLTILETVVAIAVLMICIFGIINIFPWSLQISKSASLRTIATNLGQEKIEEIIALDYEEIGTGTIETRHRLGSDVSDPFYSFERETSVIFVDSDIVESVPDMGMKKITITVYWTTQLGGDKNLQIVYLTSQF